MWTTNLCVQAVILSVPLKLPQHFFTCVREHLATDRASHIFKHLQQSVDCRTSRSSKCFGILDHATANFQLKIEESLHIQ